MRVRVDLRDERGVTIDTQRNLHLRSHRRGGHFTHGTDTAMVVATTRSLRFRQKRTGRGNLALLPITASGSKLMATNNHSTTD
jgi:hypothetical protein